MSSQRSRACACPAIQMGEDGGVARRKTPLRRPGADVIDMTGQINLGIEPLNFQDERLRHGKRSCSFEIVRQPERTARGLKGMASL